MKETERNLMEVAGRHKVNTGAQNSVCMCKEIAREALPGC